VGNRDDGQRIGLAIVDVVGVDGRFGIRHGRNVCFRPFRRGCGVAIDNRHGDQRFRNRDRFVYTSLLDDQEVGHQEAS
jgi:hypothetical protein